MIIDHIQSRRRVNVWAGMGMGKSSSTLTALTDFPVLIVAPKRVASATWDDECHKWAHLTGLKVSKVLGNPAQRMRALQTPADIYTTNYDNALWLREQWDHGNCPKWLTMVCDESTRLSSFRLGNKRTRAYSLGVIASQMKRYINLTGTPTPLGLTNLWGPQWFVDRGKRLGHSFESFERRWFRRRPNHDDYGMKLIAYPHAMEEITTLLRDTTISINAKDYMSVDEPIFTTVGFDLPPKARDFYDEMEKTFYLEAHDIEAPHAASKLTKCLQIASGFIYDEDRNVHHLHDAKIEALQSIVSEANGMPVLVSQWWKPDRDKILAAFPDARALESDQDIEDWNAGKVPMLVANPLSCGHGLNLQHGGNILVYYSDYYNMEAHAQMLERVGPTRQKMSGYDRPTFVYTIAANDSIELDVIKSHREKISLQEIVLKKSCKLNSEV